MPDRRTPDSVGVTFRVLRVMRGLSRREYAKVLAKTRGRFGSDKFSATQISDIEKSRTLLYWHHARYANDTGYPAGLIFLISRLSSDLRDNRVEEARELLIGLREFVSQAIDKLDDIAAVTPANKDRGRPAFMDEYRNNADEDDMEFAQLPEEERAAKIAGKERCAL
jgi:transcriptional regulator with XRE-family HTH domain